MSMSGARADCAPFLLRSPSVSETHLAFGYGGNIWITSRDGSELRRLTSEGYESLPVFSPDGKQIAFVGEYGGPRGVFVVPTSGGEPRRLTYHPDDLGVTGIRTGDALGWAPDGKRILFSSRRTACAGGGLPVIQLFTIPIEGGCATRVPLVRAAQGVFSPDATRMAYVPNAKWQPEWKRYRGGETTPIWIADLASSNVEARIPRDNSNDFNPMWIEDAIYFLSDRNGPVTLFAYDVDSGKVRQVVKNDGLDIKAAAACADAIVYEQFGSLHLLDLKTEQDRVLDIRPSADFPEVRARFKSLGEIVGTAAWNPEIKPKLSPTGACAAFAVHGEILTVPAERGDIRNLTRTPDVMERDPAWSPDGRFIAYFSDEGGEYALHVREIRQQSGREVVRKIDLGHPPGFYYSPVWSPDGRKIGYFDNRLNYWYVDLDTKKVVLVDTDRRVDPPRVHEVNAAPRMAWSPDSRWIAYPKELANQLHAIFLYSIEQGKSYPLTDGMSDALHVAFDKGGEYLYFTASTDVGFAGDWIAMSSFGRCVTRGVYALVLKKGAPSPLVLRVAENEVATAPRNSERVEIDLEDVSERIVRLPVAAASYGSLFAGPPGTIFLTEEAPVIMWGDRRVQDVHRFELATRKAERILQGVIYFELSCSAEKMLYARAGESQRRHWFITSTQRAATESGAADHGEIRLECLQVYVDPRAEWKHIYEQSWRLQRQFFYDPGLHGLDLQKSKNSYAPFLENIVCRDDLSYLLAEMLANMTLGHMWADASQHAQRKRSKTGLLGADYCVEQGRYRFAHIYGSDPWSPPIVRTDSYGNSVPASSAPLREPGMSVQAGEYLLAVDGRDVTPTADVCSYFEETAGKQVTLTVGPEADGTGSREICVVPINDEYPLRYFAWVEGNRRKVDELTNSRVAYVHVPDCTVSGFVAFNRYFFAQVGKAAVIIDTRYNNGGQMPDYIIDCLRRSPLCYWHVPHGRNWPEPSLSIAGPKVMLINEMQMSMGDVLPWSFRRAGLGPLIGKRTWGGTVGFYEKADDILDHGFVAAPNMAFYTPEGAWEIENVGVSPDIEVDEDPKAARAGRDVQLERAVEEVMELLNKRPPASIPQPPPYPNYHRE